jgi:hypothetical protein
MNTLNIISLCISCFTLGFLFKVHLDDIIDAKDKRKDKQNVGRNHIDDKSEMVSKETTIVNDWQYGKDQDRAIIPAIHQRIEGFNVGDKVKIIVVKEAEQ